MPNYFSLDGGIHSTVTEKSESTLLLIHYVESSELQFQQINISTDSS